MKTCLNNKCQNLFDPQTYNQKYCSLKCQNNYSHRIWVAQNKKVCPDCSTTINEKSKYCKKCVHKHRHDNIFNMTIKEYSTLSSVNQHPSWRHNKIRGIARELYAKLISLPCHNCGYNKHVQICHIKPISSFSDSTTISEVNARSNIIQLCPNCHWELDKGLLKLNGIAEWTRTIIKS